MQMGSVGGPFGLELVFVGLYLGIDHINIDS